MSSKDNEQKSQPRRKSELFVSKNKEEEDKRRPSIKYVDLSGVLIFSYEDMKRELEKIPFQSLRPDDETILHRTSNVRRAPSLTPTTDLLLSTLVSGSRDHDTSSSKEGVSSLGSLDRVNMRRRRSSVLSETGSLSQETGVHQHQPEVRSFYQLIRSASRRNLQKDDETDDNEPLPYADPIPAKLRFMDLKDLVTTDIDWKMLTMIRPSSKIEEEFFSRLVQVARLHHKTKFEDGFGIRRAAFKMTRHPLTIYRYRSTNLDDVFSEMSHLIPDYDYDLFARVDPDPDAATAEQQETANDLVNRLLGDDFSENFILASSDVISHSDQQNQNRKQSSKLKVKLLGSKGKSHVAPVTSGSSSVASRSSVGTTASSSSIPSNSSSTGSIRTSSLSSASPSTISRGRPVKLTPKKNPIFRDKKKKDEKNSRGASASGTKKDQVATGEGKKDPQGKLMSHVSSSPSPDDRKKSMIPAGILVNRSSAVGKNEMKIQKKSESITFHHLDTSSDTLKLPTEKFNLYTKRPTDDHKMDGDNNRYAPPAVYDEMGAPKIIVTPTVPSGTETFH